MGYAGTEKEVYGNGVEVESRPGSILMQDIFRSPFSGELELIVIAKSQDEKAHAEETKASTIKENEALRIELDSAREQLNNLQKCREEADLKSKSDVKLLVREVKSLRSSQSEMRQELDRVSKEKMEFEVIVYLVILLFLDLCLQQMAVLIKSKITRWLE